MSTKLLYELTERHTDICLLYTSVSDNRSASASLKDPLNTLILSLFQRVYHVKSIPARLYFKHNGRRLVGQCYPFGTAIQLVVRLS